MSQIRNSPFTTFSCVFLALLNIFVYYLCFSLFIWCFFIYSGAIMGVYRSLKLYFQIKPCFHISSFFSSLLYMASTRCTGNHRVVKVGRTTGGVIWNLQFVATWSTVRELFTSFWSGLSSALVAHCICCLHLADVSLFFWNHTADSQVCFPLICKL